MLVFTLLVSSRQRLSVRIDAVDCGESAYPSGLMLSTAGKALIRQDWHCRLRGKHLSARIGTVPAGESTYPSGLALSPLGTMLKIFRTAKERQILPKAKNNPYASIMRILLFYYSAERIGVRAPESCGFPLSLPLLYYMEHRDAETQRFY